MISKKKQELINLCREHYGEGKLVFGRLSICTNLKAWQWRTEKKTYEFYKTLDMSYKCVVERSRIH